jgi:hypothetical protein
MIASMVAALGEFLYRSRIEARKGKVTSLVGNFAVLLYFCLLVSFFAASNRSHLVSKRYSRISRQQNLTQKVLFLANRPKPKPKLLFKRQRARTIGNSATRPGKKLRYLTQNIVRSGNTKYCVLICAAMLSKPRPGLDAEFLKIFHVVPLLVICSPFCTLLPHVSAQTNIL